MEIENILNKLEPLTPNRVEHWRNVRETADPELKTLLDREIFSVARRLLGDYRKKCLLSLPPKEKAKGTFNLGTLIYEKEK